MDKETYEALKNVIKIARKNALEINKRRKSKDKVWEQATLYPRYSPGWKLDWWGS